MEAEILSIETAKKIATLEKENEKLKDDLYSANQVISDLVDVHEENERLKNRNDFLEQVCVGFDDKYEDYKSRNKKAIEYNEQIIKDTKDFYRPTEDTIYSGDTLIDIATQNINILNGGEE